MIKKVFLAFALILSCLYSGAQVKTDTAQTKLNMLQHLVLFGQKIHQEKVYLHLDNTCYFLGDTLWYKAYVTRADNNQPSNISRLLYVELLTPDGFLVERQQIPVSTEGNGFGCFVLQDSLYAGYYELRAYTRWQLNFGVYEHEHPVLSERRFYNKAMAKEYFRDYDKLYSRVVPIYDKPATAGQFQKNMTVRPLRRYFAKDNGDHKAKLSFFPEGGNLVAGTTCRVAFETLDENGRHIALTGQVRDKDGKLVADISTTFRGKGTFNVTCGNDVGKIYTASIVYKNKTQTFPLPEVVPSGCAVKINAEPDNVTAEIATHNLPQTSTASLHYSIMNGGRIAALQNVALKADGTAKVDIPTDKLHTGVNEFTLFDEKGEVFADRLFFVNHHEYEQAQLSVSGMKEEYKAYEPINLNFQLKTPQKAEFSVSVRDNATDEPSYDNSNILTEMLLGSEVKGFIENPAYYFEKDDAEHRANLDLLLMVQGWRRYSWRDMAGVTEFQLTQHSEQYQTLEGSVNKTISYDDPRRSAAEAGINELDNYVNDTKNLEENGTTTYTETSTSGSSSSGSDIYDTDKSYNMVKDLSVLASRRSALKKEVFVQASFVNDGKTTENEQTTTHGQFSLLMPQSFDPCITFLAAYDDKLKAGADTTATQAKNNATDKKAKRALKKSINGFADEEAFPNYYVRRNLFYPLFVKPYSYYQENKPEYSDANQSTQAHKMNNSLKGDHVLDEIVVHANHSGLRKVDYSKPAYVADAYQLFNDVSDYGLSAGYFIFDSFYEQLAYALMGDMGNYHSYFIQKRIDGKAINEKGDQYLTSSARHIGSTSGGISMPDMPSTNPYHFTEGEKENEWRLRRLDKVYVYTDYEPRHEGSWQYIGSDKPDVIIDIHKFPNGEEQYTYRDRRYIIPGFSSCSDFYSPDYSRQPLPSNKDYRRTLYWNPVVRTDAEGKASIHLYGTARSHDISISAEGITSDGKPIVEQ